MADALQLIRENQEKHARGKGATHLDLGNCGLTELPDVLFECVWLEELILSNVWEEYDFEKKKWQTKESQNKGSKNNIKNLPHTISKLLRLKKLVVAGRLGNDEWDLFDLSPLKELQNLRILDFTSTQVSNLLPLEGLKNLQLLDVSFTQVSDLLPLKNLKKLKLLDINSTGVSDLSPLKDLHDIKLLSLSDTQVNDLSPVLSLIKKGIKVKWEQYSGDIRVKNCPLIAPPPNIIQQGNEAILNYFAELKKGGEAKGLEAKVIFIGEGQSGKTSLRTRLLKGEKAALPEPDKRTRGLEVEIEPLMVYLRGGEQMRLNIFDFGGQTHYKPLHQFFYSHRSLYVLVTRNGDDSNEFDFWFDTAQLFGGGSPVLVVNNLFGDVQSGFNRSKFARFDAIIKDSLNANLLTSDGLPAVRKRIEQLAEDLPLVHQTIPKTWANVRRDLEKLRSKNIIRLEEYLDICTKTENGEMDRERALHCSAYLHDIGVCLHYQTFPSLRRYLIVKNEWATEAVYRVMDDPEVNKAHGKFGLDDLARIWKPTQEDLERGEDFRYEDYQMELLELMREFKLCYPLRLNAREFVTPHLLPTKQEGAQKWLPDNDLQFEVEYDFMPPGLFSRFVVSRYEDIAGENRDLVWRDEVFFQWDNATANVSLPSRAGKKAIVFKVQGSDPEERKLMLTSLLRDLKKLHAETPGIAAEERIPCICQKCSASEEKQFFEHSILKDFLKEGDDAIQCQKSRKMVSVSALLGNVFSNASDRAARSHPVTDDALDKTLIRNLLKTDNLEDALALLEQHAPDDCVMLQANIARIRRSFGQGLASQEDEGKIRQLTVKAVLDWLNKR